MSAPFTRGPWHFDRMESAEEFAALKGQTLAEHEGYFRDNNGDWIVTFKDDDEDIGGRIAAVSFKGRAKRGETYRAPDPEGQANARLISAAPELYEALEEFLHVFDKDSLLQCDPELQAIAEKAAPALAKARGQ